MSYAKKNYGFSLADSVFTLNPAKAVEWQPFGPTFDYTQFMGLPYNYTVPTGSDGVDWNRDGQLLSGQWRAPLLTMNLSSCQGSAQGKTVIDPSTGVRGGVDLIRFGPRLYAFGVTEAAIYYRLALLGPAGNKSCEGSPNPLAGACLTWSPPRKPYLAHRSQSCENYRHDSGR